MAMKIEEEERQRLNELRTETIRALDEFMRCAQRDPANVQQYALLLANAEMSWQAFENYARQFLR
jgi:hypothetical protein